MTCVSLKRHDYSILELVPHDSGSQNGCYRERNDEFEPRLDTGFTDAPDSIEFHQRSKRWNFQRLIRNAILYRASWHTKLI